MAEQYKRNNFKSNNNNGSKPFGPRKKRPNAKPNPNDVKVEVGDKLLITVKRLGINGEGIGSFKRKITFIPGALPGEVVDVRVTEVTPKYIQAEIRKFKQKSPDRVEPKDDQSIGGVELAHLAYDKQLEFKQDVIRQALEKYQPRNYTSYKILPTIGMENPEGYRNKAQFPIREVKGKLAVGMYRPNSHELVDLPKISTQNPLTLKVIRTLRDIIEELEMSVYNEKKNVGSIKTLVARASHSTGEVQVTIVTNGHEFPKQDAFLDAVEAKLPEVVSVHQNVNPGKTSLVWGEETDWVWGKDYITETINGKTFKLSPRAFLQMNPLQTERLYKEVIDALDLKHADKLIDAYSGVGTIGITLADKAGEVRGMDTIYEAVEDANENAADNGLENVKYEVGEAEYIIPEWQEEGWIADAMVVDPPRTGLGSPLRKTIMQTKPEKFVYVSCNASTLARDLVELSMIYDVEYIQSIDMFPQTARWEGIVKFSLRK